ncbi:hypothetical protein [Streptomyces sp. NPDC005953]|uniref:hypothetical protein n=1 Tax=Streptomyces sp. NPDC005953 TaxID=3156719 RepID=UPI0033FC1B9C
MSESLTLAALAGPLRALWLLAADCAGLPAPYVDVSPIYPNQVRFRFHDDLTAFEAWREALNLPADTVTYREQSGRTRVLTATTEYAGVDLELVAYAEIPDPTRAVRA